LLFLLFVFLGLFLFGPLGFDLSPAVRSIPALYALRVF